MSSDPHRCRQQCRARSSYANAPACLDRVLDEAEGERRGTNSLGSTSRPSNSRTGRSERRVTRTRAGKTAPVSRPVRAPQAPRRMTRQTPDRRCRLALRSPVTADAGRSPGTYCARLDPARSRLTTLPASRSASPLPWARLVCGAKFCRAPAYICLPQWLIVHADVPFVFCGGCGGCGGASSGRPPIIF
jgi:hypothetical protein